MPAPDEFTGERFLPECTGEIWAEHWHRYLFAAALVDGLEVLDIASGEGYGSSLLAKRAKTVVGVDIDPPTVAGARDRYRVEGLRFEVGSVVAIPLPDASVDCVVSFETLEHLSEQEEMLAEIRRVLRPTGFAIISTPNKTEYSDKRGFRNEFHVRELYDHEFSELLARHFAAQRWYGQRLLFNSGLWPLTASGLPAPAMQAEWVTVSDGDRALPDPMYFVALAASSEDCLPRDAGHATLLADPEDSIYREYETTVARSLSLERLVAERERIVVERDRQVAEHDGVRRQLESLIVERDHQLAAQAERAELMERVISERDALLGEINSTIAARERVVAERDAMLAAVNARNSEIERIVVQRDAELEAINVRVATVERLIGERDAQVATLDAQKQQAEAVIAAREQLIVERDRQLEALDIAKRRAESVVVERDAQLDALNARIRHAEELIGERERIIVERDGLLAATNERMSLAERVIADQQVAFAESERIKAKLADDLQLVRQRSADVEAIAAEYGRANAALRTEVVRRASWRWWLSLPMRRMRGSVATTVDAAGGTP